MKRLCALMAMVVMTAALTAAGPEDGVKEAGAGWRQPYAADTHPRGGSSSPHDITVSTGVDAIGSIHSACPRRVSARIHVSGPAVRRTSGAN